VPWPFYTTEIKKAMSKTYRTCQALALGILVGYLGSYAWALISSEKSEKDPIKPTQTHPETILN